MSAPSSSSVPPVVWAVQVQDDGGTVRRVALRLGPQDVATLEVGHVEAVPTSLAVSRSALEVLCRQLQAAGYSDICTAADDEQRIRADERQRLAALLDENRAVLSSWPRDTEAALEMVAFLLRLPGEQLMTTASSSSVPAPSMHTIELHVRNARDWNDVEDKVADVIARYFAIPRRGRSAESHGSLLAGAVVHAGLNDAGLFDAKVEVTRG
jgi:hypothetical protein